jgi:hypothetical protein
MKNYSLLIKHVICAAIVCCVFGLSQSPSYGQGRSLTKQQLDAVVRPNLAQCTAPANTAKNVRLDPNSIIPTRNAREFPQNRVVKTLHGMWRGEVIGSPLDSKYEKSKEGNVDYFWIIDTQRNEGLIIALRNGNNSTAGLKLPGANPPKLSYLICAHEGYIPTVERGSEIHEFTKVSDSITDAPRVLAKATGLKFGAKKATLSDMWQVIVASGYFKSLPAVAFAGGLFKPMRIELVASAVGPAQVSMSWDSEYYGGGTTGIKFTPGVPMRGVEYTTFVGTSATAGDYLVASPGNGKLAKVEAIVGGDYDLAFDALSFGPLQADAVATPSVQPSQRTRSQARPQNRK